MILFRSLRSENQTDINNSTNTNKTSETAAQKGEGAWDEAITFMTIIGIIVILVVAFMTYIIVHLDKVKPDLSSQLKLIDSNYKSKKSHRLMKSPARLRSLEQKSTGSRKSAKSPKSPNDDATTAGS